jgi:hypothetical protein
MGEYQRPYIFSGTITKSVPSEDWCSVESSTPTMTRGTERPRMTRAGLSSLRRSSSIGLNSRARTVV